jgi:predicted O-methyltransferase YrrM
LGERRILEVIRELESATGNGRFFPIMGPVKGELLYTLTLVARPAAVLELGTGIGYSCLHKRAGVEDVVEVSGPSGKPSRSIHGSGPPSSRSRTASPSA